MHHLIEYNEARREKGNKRKASKENIAKLFQKKPKPSQAWKHRFVCLAHVEQDRIPTAEWEKDELLEAGLGEKEIIFEDLELSADEFRDFLYEKFPGLKHGGGFRFYKCIPNTRRLEALSLSVMSSPAMLKSRVGNARTYIKPLQKSLDLSPICDLPSGVSPSIYYIIILCS